MFWWTDREERQYLRFSRERPTDVLAEERFNNPSGFVGLEPPPPGTARRFIQTPDGPLEILESLPASPPLKHGTGATMNPVTPKVFEFKEQDIELELRTISSARTATTATAVPAEQETTPLSDSPILFVHGYMGCAYLYRYLLPWLAGRGYPCYAVSLRGHGASWYPTYSQMYATPKEVLALDLKAAVEWVMERHNGNKVILAGHSMGGGLSQYALGKALIDVRGLILLASAAPQGGFTALFRWLSADPWLPFRMIRDRFHPRSLLPTTKHVHNLWFSKDSSIEKVRDVERTIPPYDTAPWRTGMLLPFVNCEGLSAHIIPPTTGHVDSFSRIKPKILVVGAARDRVIGLADPKRTFEKYASLAAHREEVRYVVVEKSGHHVMFDECWEECARVIEEFAKEVDGIE